MAHAKRSDLEILSYVKGIPAAARCKSCGKDFHVEESLLSHPQEALIKFYADFDGHNCTPRSDI